MRATEGSDSVRSHAKASSAGSTLRQAKKGPGALCATLVALLAALACTGIGAPATAGAAPKAVLGSFGTPNGSKGGELLLAKSVAVNRSGVGAPAGSVYVAEANPNHRISHFDKDGIWIRSWGYDVVEGGGVEFEVCEVASECKGGASGGAAGQLANPQGIAIDQSTGILYVTSSSNRRVDMFSGTGDFIGAFGYDVLPGDVNPSGPDFCTAATGCQAAAPGGAQAGRFANLIGANPGTDPSVAGRVYVPDNGNLRVAQYSTTVVAGTLTSATFDQAFGWGVDTGAPQLEGCTLLSECQVGLSGNGAGQFTSGGSPTVADVDGSGRIYVTSGPLSNGTCSVSTPCRVQRFAPDASSASDFGPVVTSGAAQAVAPVNLAVDAAGHMFVLRKTSTTSYEVAEYDSAGVFIENHPGSGPLGAVGATTSTGLAVGNDGLLYTNYGSGGSGEVFIMGPVPPAEVELVPPVEEITGTSATVNGVVTIEPPGGPGFEAAYRFELSTNGTQWSTVAQGVTDSAAGSYPVSVELEDLNPNTQYLIRLSATTGDEVVTPPLSFETAEEAPRVALTYTEEVTQGSANLGAHVDPQGLKTTYHFEWGETPAYGNRVPAFERQLGSGNEPVIALDAVSGLQADRTYHFRVVATNGAGTTHGPDQEFETLNECGFTSDRCLELVSPSDKGPVGAAGDWAILGFNLQFQPHPTKPAIAYTMAYGLPDANSGGEVFYEAQRDDQGWASVDLNPIANAVPPSPGSGSPTSRLGMAADLSCEVLASTQRLSDDAPEASLQAEHSILYLRNTDGEYEAITDTAATNAPAPKPLPLTEYILAGLSKTPSEACRRVVFSTPFQYPGVAGAGTERLYEWEGGTLRNVGEVEGPSGPVAVAAVAGAIGGRNFTGSVSSDGSRIIFSALRQTSVLAAELGQSAVFVREDGATGEDVTLSQTGTPNDGPSRYELASEDGGEVFFTARYGLASNGTSAGMSACAANSAGGANGAGCDLYRYSVATGDLVDLSVPGDGSNPAGASVAGVLGTSADGSTVYFAARGQLVPGEGNTEAENLAEQAYSVYRYRDGSGLALVGSIAQQDAVRATSAASTNPVEPRWSSRVTPSGDQLLFESRASFTEFDSEGRFEAYLYDAANGVTSCVSCRRDGQSSVASEIFRPLSAGIDNWNPLAPPQSLTDDGSRVFFTSPNRLAAGATDGQPNLYQWENGQISLIGSSELSPTSAVQPRFAGASANGDDLYFTSVDRLTWQDTDGKTDIYDARVGGGIPQPSPPPAPCDPTSESACQGRPSSVPPGGRPASADIVGSGNVDGAENERRDCRRAARRAKRAGIHVKRLRISARKAGRDNRRRAARLNRKARRVGRRAKELRSKARACQKWQRANNDRRAGK